MEFILLYKATRFVTSNSGLIYLSLYYPWQRLKYFKPHFNCSLCFIGARGGAAGWGTALQSGRSRSRFTMVSLEFSIGIILPAALWPWCWHSLKHEWVSGIFLGGKGGRCV